MKAVPFPNHGEGFCPFNDVAVGRVHQREVVPWGGPGLEDVAGVDERGE